MVELIIVIVIIAVLAAVLAPQYLRFVEDSRESTDVSIAASIEKVVNIFVATGDLTPGDEVRWNTTNGALFVWTGSPFTENSALAINVRNQLGVSADTKNKELVTESVNASSAGTITSAINEVNGIVTVSVEDRFQNLYDYNAWAD